MKKLSKKNEKILRDIEKELPVEHYQMMNRHTMLGSDVLLAGYKLEDIEARIGDIDPEKEYIVHVPGTMQKNHFRRMKRIFQKHGAAALYKYLLPYVKEDKRWTVLNFVHSLH